MVIVEPLRGLLSIVKVPLSKSVRSRMLTRPRWLLNRAASAVV